IFKAKDEILANLRHKKDLLGDMESRLAGADPYSCMEKGFAMVRCGSSGKLVTDVAKVKVGDKLNIEFKDGSLSCLVLEKNRSGK
ncbi:MAG: hypothetical protein GXO58_07630, partial [Thermodesulfobacteria bacterium]|nr:hypothetical protein [Thermodesulfobacteriota bacterium]